MNNEPKTTVSAPEPTGTVTIAGEDYVILLKSQFDALVSGSGGEGEGGGGDVHGGNDEPG